MGIYNIGISWLVEVDIGEVELCVEVLLKDFGEFDRNVEVVRNGVVLGRWNDVVV